MILLLYTLLIWQEIFLKEIRLNLNLKLFRLLTVYELSIHTFL